MTPSEINNLKDGEPCSHPGCLSHVSHPCEVCGRVAGRKLVTPTEINERLAKLLGIKPKIFYHYADAPGTEYYPDFCRDPRLVLREMDKLPEDFAGFINSLRYEKWYELLMDETGKLAMKAIEYLEARK
jgi:hypothetical protein